MRRRRSEHGGASTTSSDLAPLLATIHLRSTSGNRNRGSKRQISCSEMPRFPGRIKGFRVSSREVSIKTGADQGFLSGTTWSACSRPPSLRRVLGSART